MGVAFSLIGSNFILFRNFISKKNSLESVDCENLISLMIRDESFLDLVGQLLLVQSVRIFYFS